MKRSPIRPSLTPLRKRNSERRRRAFVRAFYSTAFVTWTARQPSCISGNMGCVCSHSARSRGAGGTYRDVCPITRDEHQQEHSMGVAAFWALHGKDPRREARRHWRRFLAWSETP